MTDRGRQGLVWLGIGGARREGRARQGVLQVARKMAVLHQRQLDRRRLAVRFAGPAAALRDAPRLCDELPALSPSS